MTEQLRHLRFLDDEVGMLVPDEPVTQIPDATIEAVIGGGQGIHY